MLYASTTFAQQSPPCPKPDLKVVVSGSGFKLTGNIENLTGGVKSVSATVYSLGGIVSFDTCMTVQEGITPVSSSQFSANGYYLLVIAYTGNSCNSQSSCLTITPVKYSSIKASRKSASQVEITWGTSMEINNRAFKVQRKLEGSQSSKWEDVAMIQPKSTGNSNLPQSYQYTDANSYKGLTLYRIIQVDADGKSSLSEVRSVKQFNAVRGMEVSPNPSYGNVLVTFDENANRNLSLHDASGKLIKVWKNSPGNTVQIDNLERGTYIVKSTKVDGSESEVKKIIVQ